MQNWQDSLFNLGQKIYAPNTSELERIESNFLFIKILVSALKEPNSYFFNFDKLKIISSVRSPDDTFRIFSWNIPMHDGSYLYYGSIQRKSGSLNLIPLLDKTFEIKNAELDIVGNDFWYGAQYYDIIPFQKDKYILLGWKGHNAQNTKKVIEVLRFMPNGDIKLGDNIFLEDTSLARKIFTYAKEATMLLAFQNADHRIIFDHLVPLEDSTNQRNVPDLTHDAYLLEGKGLKLLKDVLVLNLDN
ncbi:hypothetical protein [Sphingobacterium bovistauri]|uniref:DKNYY family protein n=1 Tax=Sphingobacterium bovistauri TaxID=2781959 RepID=A0ABS7Z0S4_9SPHI|nr:hypothetical protein [Sphingobacterium bovistauri]MCA5003765.1 hypothetical protein [Sphingobacterium bovistauri]